MRAPGHRGRAADSGPAPVRVSAPPLSGRVTPASGGPDRAGSRVPSPAHRPGSSTWRRRPWLVEREDADGRAPRVRGYLGLGSNLGDRLANLQRAVDLLSNRGVRTLRSSRVYETEPVGPPQPDFLNAVVEVATALA